MFYTEENRSIKYIKSTIFDDEKLVHAFSSRIGGNTPEPMNSFSLGTAGNVAFKAYIEDNRKSVCDILGINYNLIINPDQKHTDNIKIIASLNDDLSETDGVITAIPGLVLLLLFADCVPIILFAPKEKVLGVIHAGWRGTAKKIVQKAITMFDKEFNVPPENVKAAIGPAIGQCCYPVSLDVARELKNSIDQNCDNIFKNVGDSDLIKIGLKELNGQQLLESGVVDIDIYNGCTSCNNSLFYSYRADNGKTGRHGAIASLR